MSYYKIKAKGDKAAEISIYGDIGESWWNDESVTARQFVKDIAALDVDNLTVRINSYGGAVSDGIAIYNALKRHKASITVAIDGVAVSIASLIAMAGDTVEMAENALMMIHAPWSYTSGNANDMRKAADVLDTFAAAMSTSYANKTGKSKDDVMSWLTDGEDHWFTAAEAQAENLVDTIVDAQLVAAQFDMNRFKTIPAAAGIFNKPPTQEKPMPNRTAPTPAAAAPQPAEQPQTTIVATSIQPSEAEIKAQVLAAENQRRADIRAKFGPLMAKYPSAGLDQVMNQCLDDSNISVQAAIEKLMDKLGEGVSPTAGGFTSRVETGESDAEKFARGVGQALMARCGREKHDPQNEFRGFRLEDIARASLERAGVNVRGMDRLRMATAALARRPVASGYGQSTSDFPVLLENVLHKMVLVSFTNTPDTWSKVCKIGQVSDFREWLRLRTGSIGDIDEVTESGSYVRKQIPDAKKEGVTAKRRGNIIGITPEVIINDDIGYISDLTTNVGRAGKRTIESKFYALLAANPTMKDGFALFSTDHANLAGSAAAPTVDSLEAGRVAMAKQKDLNGVEILDIRPNIWLGPLAKGGDARVVINSTYDPDTANKIQRENKVRNLVSEIIDTGRITGNEWYLFADPNVAPVIEVVFLDGQSEPQVIMQESFETAGVDYRVELPFGIGAVGFEGAYKNAGA
jgi:ATP-dependent protease ClpP protease subunit